MPIEQQAIHARVPIDVERALQGETQADHAKRSRGEKRRHSSQAREHFKSIHAGRTNDHGSVAVYESSNYHNTSNTRASGSLKGGYSSETTNTPQTRVSLGTLSGSVSTMRNIDVHNPSDVVHGSAKYLADLNTQEGQESFTKALNSLSNKELTGIQNLDKDALTAIGLDKPLECLKKDGPKGCIKEIREVAAQMVNAVTSQSENEIATAKAAYDNLLAKTDKSDPNQSPLIPILFVASCGALLGLAVRKKSAPIALAFAIILTTCSRMPPQSPEYASTYQALDQSSGAAEVSTLNNINLADPNAVNKIESFDVNAPDAAKLVKSMQDFITENKAAFKHDGIDPTKLTADYYHIGDGQNVNITVLRSFLSTVPGQNGPVDQYLFAYLDPDGKNAKVRIGIADPNTPAHTDKQQDIPATIFALLREGQTTTDPLMVKYTLDGVEYWVFFDPNDSGRALEVKADNQTTVTGGDNPPVAPTIVAPGSGPTINFSEVSYNPNPTPIAENTPATPATVSSPTAEVTPLPATPEVKVEFCDLATATSLQDIKDRCTIPFEDIKHLDASLQQLSQPFDQSLFKPNIYITDAGRFIMFGTGNNQNYFKNDAEKPFRKNLVAYSTITYEILGTIQTKDFLILLIEVPDPNNPNKSLWVKGIFPDPDFYEKQGNLKELLNLWQSNQTPLIIKNSHLSGIKSNIINPIVSATFEKYDMDQKFADAISSGTLTSLTAPDMFVEVSIGK